MKNLQKSIIGIMAILMLLGGSVTPINAGNVNNQGGSTNWNGGRFEWGLGFEPAYNLFRGNTIFTSRMRLILHMEVQNRTTGAHIQTITRDSTTNHQSTGGQFDRNRSAFGSHEARGTTSIGRHTFITRQ